MAGRRPRARAGRAEIVNVNTELSRASKLERLLGERIVLLDGAMGTMIQTYGLDEAGFRGERFKDWPHDLKGNNDLLSLTQPQIIQAIHREYLEAGADIVETNTFNCTTISLADYKLEAFAYELNVAGGRNARAAADAVMAAPHPGRTKLASTIHRENRRVLNKYSEQLTEKALAKALQGDGAALLACSNLLLAANKEQPK